jgi:hypothetical protein
MAKLINNYVLLIYLTFIAVQDPGFYYITKNIRFQNAYIVHSNTFCHTSLRNNITWLQLWILEQVLTDVLQYTCMVQSSDTSLLIILICFNTA